MSAPSLDSDALVTQQSHLHELSLPRKCGTEFIFISVPRKKNTILKMICQLSKCHKQFVFYLKELNAINYSMIYLQQELLNTVDQQNQKKWVRWPSSQKYSTNCIIPSHSEGRTFICNALSFSTCGIGETYYLLYLILQKHSRTQQSTLQCQERRVFLQIPTDLQHEWAFEILSCQPLLLHFMSGRASMFPCCYKALWMKTPLLRKL